MIALSVEGTGSPEPAQLYGAAANAAIHLPAARSRPRPPWAAQCCGL